MIYYTLAWSILTFVAFYVLRQDNKIETSDALTLLSFGWLCVTCALLFALYERLKPAWSLFKEWWNDHVYLNYPYSIYWINIRRFFRIRQWVKMFYWLPIIWVDEDWDHVYLLELMKFKIDRMALNQKKNKNHVEWRASYDSLKKCSHLLKRLINDEYFGEAGYIPKKLIINSEGVIKSATKKDAAQFRKIAKQAGILLKSDEKEFMDTFLKNYRTWWD